MELTTKQRAQLRAMANGLPVVLTIGKDGVTPATQKEAYDALQARELIKASVLQSAPVTAREACEELCRLTGAQPVQVLGHRFVLYRRNDKEPKIQL